MVIRSMQENQTRGPGNTSRRKTTHKTNGGKQNTNEHTNKRTEGGGRGQGGGQAGRKKTTQEPKPERRGNERTAAARENNPETYKHYQLRFHRIQREKQYCHFNDSLHHFRKSFSKAAHPFSSSASSCQVLVYNFEVKYCTKSSSHLLQGLA